MKMKILYFYLFPFLLCFCKNENREPIAPGNQPVQVHQEKFQMINPGGMTISTRFRPPIGFEREADPENSFASYLRNLPLKPDGAPVLLYNKDQKYRQDVHAAVIDVDTGNRDLQQCADAVMRLRAEYLYGQKQFDKIHFKFNSGFNAEYRKWRNGKRISVKGNNVNWVQGGRQSDSYASFRKYLNMVFSYAGTWSLAKEMNRINAGEMQIGDVFIFGGSPGHAVIVVDMATNPKTHKKVFMLAQSYMPAQDIHILKNPSSAELSPWYDLDFGNQLLTPEWDFKRTDLKRF